MADASNSFYGNYWRHHVIAARVKDHLCVSQVPWFYQRPYLFKIFLFISTLREIWILPINSTLWRHNDYVIVSITLRPEVGNWLVAVGWAVLKLWREASAPLPPPRSQYVALMAIFIIFLIIVGFHMTSLKFKLKNYRTYRDFTFTMN